MAEGQELYQKTLERRRAFEKRDRRRRRWRKLWGPLLGTTLALAVGAAGIMFLHSRSGGLFPGTETTPTLPAEILPDRVIHFAAGGDLNVTDKVVASGKTGGGYDYTGLFRDVLPQLAGADLTAVNLEGNAVGAPYGTDTRSVPAEMLSALKNAGVDLIQTANSMSIYNGIAGLASTISAIRESGMTPLGTYATNAEFTAAGGYELRQVGGIRVAVVAFTKGMDGMGLPAGSEHCVNLLYTDYNSAYQKVDTKGISALLERVRSKNPDIIIALVHWGSEFNSKVSSSQEKIVKLLQNSGVSVILGTHSHYVQTAQYDAERGTFLAYCLGDLVGDGDKAGTDYSVLVDLEITKSGATGKTAVTGFTYTPIYLDRDEQTGSMRLLRIRDAMMGYENNAVGKVSPEAYAAMASALRKIESRMP